MVPYIMESQRYICLVLVTLKLWLQNQNPQFYINQFQWLKYWQVLNLDEQFTFDKFEDILELFDPLN